MKMNSLFLYGACTFILFSACNNNEQKAAEDQERSTEQNESQQGYKEGFTDFMEQILIGFEMSGISKHMIHTPYKFLGETELLMNYEAQDENKVNHFISFHKHKDAPEQMSALVYNIDFKNKNSHLVMEYQQKLIAQLDAVYGEWSESFETGYNNQGNYEAEWYFEAGVLLIIVGTDFIVVDLHEH